MRFLVFGMAAVAAVLLPASVSAQTYEDASKGIYFEIRGGGTLLSDADNSGAGITTDIVIESEFDLGFVVEGAVGYAHDSGVRGELALGYRQNDFDKLTITNDGGVGAFLGVGSLNGISVNTDGDVGALSFMANGYYDFDLGSKFKPFVGVGLGVALIDVDASVLGVTIVDDDDTVFAYQGMAGVSYEISESISASLFYNYFATIDPEFTDAAGGSFDSEYQSHNFMVGVRISR